MNYRYLYQTKTNENREGWIKARDRADAYTQLRKQGIRPYRVIGNDPTNWVPWAVGGVISLLVAAVIGLLALLGRAPDGSDEGDGPLARGQIGGDAAFVDECVTAGWTNLFSGKLDRCLAAYAIPGTFAEVPVVLPSEHTALVAELEADPQEGAADERSECRRMRRIVLWMREELRGRLKSGESVADYLAFLETRQRRERDLRERAVESVRRAPESYRYSVWRGVNARLEEMGLELIEKPTGVTEEQPFGL